MDTDYDLCIIGGGINGAAIARDAAGRGFSVLLVEAQDLAGATSSASTKLIHGGLRYLEQYDFGLVRKSLQERETMLRSAPHIIWPMQFILPHDPVSARRPGWMIRTGLFLYDRLGGKTVLPRSGPADFSIERISEPLKKSCAKGFSYYDCWVDDSRLVVLNALDAYERGADILTRTACMRLDSMENGKGWRIALRDMMRGDEFTITASMIVNAGGPWTGAILEASALNHNQTPCLRLVQGSHIIVPRLFGGAHSYLLPQPDGRVVFAIPYESRYTMIGTTETEFSGDPAAAAVTREETEYLCAAVNRFFQKQIAPEDVRWSSSGVRALLDDGHEDASSVTRGYKLYLDDRAGPPILSVFGGKITTARALAEEAVNKLCAQTIAARPAPWTAGSVLPGGDIKNQDFALFLKQQEARYSMLPKILVDRYARSYGTRMDSFLQGVEQTEDLGRDFGSGLYEAEVVYLLSREFAMNVEDILWRRTKMGLHLRPADIRTLEEALPELKERARTYGSTRTSGD